MANSHSKLPAVSKQSHKGHGPSSWPEYTSWRSMRDRCYNPKARNYRHYGGRGITVCERWRTSFAAFLADMGRKPSIKHTLDRYPDNNGNYEPGNCRWATPLQQCQNMRTTRLIAFNGESLSVAAWARRLGLDHSTLQERLAKYPVEIALGTPRTPGGWNYKLA